MHLAQPLSDVVLGIGSNDDVADGPQTAVVTISVGPGSSPAFAALGVQSLSVTIQDGR